jgi:hypothetical protein
MDYEWTMNEPQSHGWKSMWINSIHDVIISNIDVYNNKDGELHTNKLNS